MRIVAISDTHFPFKEDIVPEGDVLLHAGDLMYDGTLSEWKSRVDSLAAMKTRKYSRDPFSEVIYVPGNHDAFVDRFRSIAKLDLDRIGVELLCADTHVLPNGMTVLGLPFVTGLQGWSYNREEWELEELVDMLPPADIVVSHSPPRIDGMDGAGHWGVYAWIRYQKLHKPKIWINGHIHENHGKYEHNGTKFYNVSVCTRQYKQAQPAAVIHV